MIVESAEEMDQDKPRTLGTQGDAFVGGSSHEGKQQNITRDGSSSDYSYKNIEEAKNETPPDENPKASGSIRGHSQYWSETKPGLDAIPAAEEGNIPQVKEIILSMEYPPVETGSCRYDCMWKPENRSNAVVVGYFDSVLAREDTKNTAAAGECTARPCPSAIMINYRPLLALLERLMGINPMPTPCL